MTEVLLNDICAILYYPYSNQLFEKTMAGVLGMCWYAALLCYYRLNRLCASDRTGTFCSLASRNCRDC